MTDLVLVGAGHAHVEVLRRLALRPEPGLRLTLVTRAPTTPYSGRVPALIRGEYGPRDAEIDLGPLTAAAGARLVVGVATGLDLGARTVAVEGRPAVRFDLLSLDIGGVPSMPAGDAAGDGIGVKPIGALLAALAGLEQALGAGGRLALVGGGAAGTELALALAARFGRRVRLTLVCDTPEPLSDAPAKARAVVRAALAEAGVELVCGVRAVSHAGGKLVLSDGSVLEVARVVWATPVRGPALLAESGLACDAAGCVVVEPSLRSRSHDFVFAAGDCAAIAAAPRPKAGVWAVRAGPVLAANLRRAARRRRPRAWRPQARALAILGLGHGRAVAWRGGVAASGRVVAWCKDWLDGRFLRRYAAEALPWRPADAGPARVALDLADLTVIAHRTVSAGLELPAGARLVQQGLHLLAPVADPYDFGRIAAARALAALHAAGARPWTAVAVVAPEPGAEAAARADVLALLQGIESVLEADGARLVDGVAAPSGVASVSLMLTGVVAANKAATGSRAGDALILTRPLGSGLLLHGARTGLVMAGDMLGAVARMTESSAAAAGVLRDHEAAGCVAVGESGVIGALTALLRAANLVAVLWPGALPALPGALALARRLGLRREAAANLGAWPDAPDRPEVTLLADPQLAGGLLACVPGARAETCLHALQRAGYEAAIIGAVEARRRDSPRLRLADRGDA